MRFAVASRPTGAVKLSGEGPGGLTVDLSSTVTLALDKGVRTARIPLACLSPRPLGAVRLASEGALGLRIQSITITPEPGPASCQGPF